MGWAGGRVGDGGFRSVWMDGVGWLCITRVEMGSNSLAGEAGGRSTDSYSISPTFLGTVGKPFAMYVWYVPRY